MPESACVSTSSVTKTLLTLSSRIRACEPLSMSSPYYASGGNLVQLYSVVIVVRRHIGEDHPVPDLQAVLHLNGVHRAAPERNLGLRGILPIRFELEQLHRRVLLAEDRPAHEHHVVELLELDRAVDAQVRAKNRGQGPL